MIPPRLTITTLPQRLAVCRLPAGDPVPDWGLSADFHSITRTCDELSIVCAEQDVPAGVRAERGFRALKVKGPIDFAVAGVLASLAKPLADAGVSLFAVSTYDTDYLLVRASKLINAQTILRREGFQCL